MLRTKERSVARTGRGEGNMVDKTFHQLCSVLTTSSLSKCLDQPGPKRKKQDL